MGKNLYIVWEGPKGTKNGAEGEVVGVAIFRKGVPTELPEPTAKHIVELAEEKAGEVKVPLPAHFRYASEDEMAEIAKAAAEEEAKVKAAEDKAAKAAKAAEKAAVKAAAAATAAAAEPAEEASAEEGG